MEKKYNFKKVEQEILKKPCKKIQKGKGKYYTILLPPPNITGSLHLGHALNATIIDILIRYHRIKEEKSTCLPGTDHAGIATQNVVEKELKKEGKNRWTLGRKKFIEKVWQWKKQYGNIILQQLKKLGLAADWERKRFTMDEKYSQAVKKAFIHYYKKGLIYRKEKTINWCPKCQTSLSDLELEYKQEKTKLWYIRYKIQDTRYKIQKNIIVATTRPETMLGDTAIAVNPKDERYKNLIGRKAILPLVNREIPIIAHKRIDQSFGTGAVKITPAHDLLDYEIGEENKLPVIQVIDKYGKINCKEYKKYNGLPSEEARKLIVQDLNKLEYLEKEEDYTHNVSLCYRCHCKIEPIPSLQWFVKMKDLAKTAVNAVKSKEIKIIPKKFEKIYFGWLKNIKDWCISRQIWWGHQLPVWFCQNQTGISNSQFPISKSEGKFIVALNKPKKCPFCGKCEMKQSEDVLDTWFSSALWPFAGLTKKDLQKFYPSNVLVTGRDIINLWVARMIFSGLEFMRKKPFSIVFIHPTILTKEGKRMSKSLGTGVDPLEIINKYGADSLRFGIIWQLGKSQDIRWDETSIMAGKKFCNKIWNAARFVKMQCDTNIQMHTNDTNINPKTPGDKRILKQLKAVKKSAEKDIENFEFGRALRKIYHFFWHQFCDVYIERFKKQKKKNYKVLSFILKECITMLHPFMPFITEKIHG